jgi:RNA polymerase sigma-70 factor (ECF subfamily)
MTDEELIKEVRSVDKDKFGEIILRYEQRLFSYIMTFVFDQQKAEDILQNCFIKIYINLNSFDADKKFSSWAYRIAHNESINYLKKYKREVSLDKYENWLNNIADERVDLANEVDKNIEKSKVQKAVFELPMKYKEALMLYYFEGVSYQGISQILHIPISTVSTRILRAKKKLKKILEPGGLK